MYYFYLLFYASAMDLKLHKYIWIDQFLSKKQLGQKGLKKATWNKSIMSYMTLLFPVFAKDSKKLNKYMILYFS